MGKSGKIFTSVLVWVFLIGTSLFVVYPLVYVAAAAFSPQQNIASLSIIPFGNGGDDKKFYLLISKNGFSALVSQHAYCSGGNNSQHSIYLCIKRLCIFQIPFCV